MRKLLFRLLPLLALIMASCHREDQSRTGASSQAGEQALDRGMNALEKQADYDLAISLFSDAISAEPSSWRGYFGRGRAYTGKKLHEAAAKDFTEVIKRDPKNALAYVQRGVCYAEMDQLVNAISDADRAVQLGQRSVNPRGQIAVVYARRAQDALRARDWFGVVKLFSKAEQAEPDNCLWPAGQASAWMAQDGWDPAIKDFERALRLGWKDPEANALLAKAYMGHAIQDRRERNQETSWRNYQKAVSLDQSLKSQYHEEDFKPDS